jgi:hypothetical protein
MRVVAEGPGKLIRQMLVGWAVRVVGATEELETQILLLPERPIPEAVEGAVVIPHLQYIQAALAAQAL